MRSRSQIQMQRRKRGEESPLSLQKVIARQ
ncbi:Uncharacterised protein [Actinobacillus ureae]|nr:Uncharacterised protein [Actinobacillus ureae]SUU50002.1 Uncharacterised protein [Actinobacillus ureae]